VSTTDPATIVPVSLGSRSYDVRVGSDGASGFGPFARSALGRTWAGRPCRRALLVTDAHLQAHATSYVAALAAEGIEVERAVVPPGEATKSLDRAADLYDVLVRMKADRHTCVVALGGGVVGDLAGFVAATYARGLPLLMVPTSLLAQVDSAVGGKVGVNHPRAKNIIGAFHQPAGVWIDTGALATLPPRELRCGLAEVIKARQAGTAAHEWAVHGAIMLSLGWPARNARSARPPSRGSAGIRLARNRTRFRYPNQPRHHSIVNARPSRPRPATAPRCPRGRTG
jgi:3-dehydroquinate synthetase